jgi:hypothetical protein
VHIFSFRFNYTVSVVILRLLGDCVRQGVDKLGTVVNALLFKFMEPSAHAWRIDGKQNRSDSVCLSWDSGVSSQSSGAGSTHAASY